MPLGPRADRLQIRAGAGLGHRDRADQLAFGKARQVPALLVHRAVVEQVMGGDRMHADAHAGERPPRHLLVQHRLVAEIAAGATPFLGNIDAQKAEFARPPPQRVPDMAAPPRFGILRQHLGLDEAHPGIAEAFHLLISP